LSERLGPLAYGEDEGEVFLGRSVTQQKTVSDETAHAIDDEIRRIVDRNYQRAKDILEANLDTLHSMAEALMMYETIDAEQIDDIMNGQAPRPPKGWNDTGRPRPPKAPLRDNDSQAGTIGGPVTSH
ncbi:MAG: hypothetical protein ACREBP_00665, partial [Sphingomicrobium sp.]